MGRALDAVSVRDVMVPGELRHAALRVVTARQEGLAQLERVDAEFEHQRQRLLAVFDQLEEAVNAQVAAEQRAADLEAELAMTAARSAAEIERLRAEIAAIDRTKLMRITAPARSVYRRLRAKARG